MVTNSLKYKYHKVMAEDLARVICEIRDVPVSKDNPEIMNFVSKFIGTIEVEVLDINPKKSDYACFTELRSNEPDLLITFDCTLFNILSTGDTLALNSLKCKCMHIIFEKTDIHSGELFLLQNCSMFTYVRSGEDIELLRNKYMQIPNLYNFCKVDYKAKMDADREKNREAMRDFVLEIIEKHRKIVTI